MIDFTNLPRRNKTYGGANGSKRSVIYQDEQYMLKFPPHPSRNRDMSYANSCLSEYLGCHIFALAGIMFMTGKGSFIAELHHQPLGVIGLLGMLVLFAPGLMPCSWKSVQEKTIWGTFLLLGGAMTMTTAMTQSGLAQWLADHIHAWVVGMSWWQIMRRIVLPQALRTAVPALSNSLIGMIKDTSLASNITVAELFMAGQRVAARTYIFLPIYCEVAVVYLLFCTVITKLQALLERQLNARGFQ